MTRRFYPHDPQIVQRQATTKPATADESARTVDMVLSTGAGVMRSTGFLGLGEPVLEELEISEDAVRMGRLNNGRAPLMVTHDIMDADQQIGVIEPDSARVEGGELVATARFSRREKADEFFQDVMDGIRRNISVGYKPYRTEVTERDGEPDLHRVVDWEPMEASVVPVGADPAAAFRSLSASARGEGDGEAGGENTEGEAPEGRQAGGDEPAEPSSPDDGGDDVGSRADDGMSGRHAAGTEHDDGDGSMSEPTETRTEEQIRAEERQRIDTIKVSARKLGLGEDHEVVRTAIDNGRSVEAARDALFEQAAEAEERAGVHGQVVMTRDEADKNARCVQDAVLYRANPQRYQRTEAAQVYRGMTLLELAREHLRQSGVSTEGMARHEVAQMALRSSSYHATSDFPKILANVIDKRLRDAYAEQPVTYTSWARQDNFMDLRDKKPVALSEAPSLVVVPEGAPYPQGALKEVGETLTPEKRGLILALTWEALMKDDLSVFDRLPTMLVASARRTENQLAYGILTGNPNVVDGNPLFSSAHNNQISSGAAPSISELDKMQQKLATQTAPNGATLNVNMAYWLTPMALKGSAQQVVGEVVTPRTANQPSEALPEFTSGIRVVSDAELDKNNTKKHYGAANPNQIDTIQYGFLDGEQGIVTEQRTGFEVDGVEVKVRHVFGVGAVDFRGLVEDPGQ